MKWLAVAALMTACGGSRIAPERLGDEAWYRGDYAAASVEYQRAGDSPRLLAKRADASLLAGRLTPSALLFRQLAESDPTRASEAATGLVRVATAAERSGDQASLGLSIAALRSVAPGWPLGRLALRLSPDTLWDASIGAALAPAGIAAGGVAERWLLTLGRARQRTGRCVDAVAPFETIRRRETGAVADTAGLALGACELTLGLSAAARGEAGEAEQWYERATARDPNGATGRRALVALGDLRMGRGELLAAFLAWQQVITAPVPPDSITVLALDRLRATQSPESFSDSSVVPGPH